MAGIQAHKHLVAHLGVAQWVPGIENIVRAEGDVNSLVGKLLHPGHAATLGIGVSPSAQMDVDAGVGHKVDAGELEDTHETNDISVVIAVHGGGVGGGDHVLHARLIGTGGQGLQAPGGLVINFIAVDVNELIVLLSQVEANVQGLHRVLPGKLKVGNGACGVRSHLQGLLQKLLSLGVAQDAVLGESHDLNVHVVPDFLPQLQDGLQGGELRVVDIHVGTHILDAVGRLHPDSLVDPLLHLLLGEEGLVLLPALNAFKQGSGEVPAGTARGQAGVQVYVGLHKGGQHHLARTVGDRLLPRDGLQIGSNLCKLPVGDPNVHRLLGVA